jgi:hypothetical protein
MADITITQDFTYVENREIYKSIVENLRDEDVRRHLKITYVSSDVYHITIPKENREHHLTFVLKDEVPMVSICGNVLLLDKVKETLEEMVRKSKRTLSPTK